MSIIKYNLQSRLRKQIIKPKYLSKTLETIFNINLLTNNVKKLRTRFLLLSDQCSKVIVH
jgi:hypothetical protein